jgi:hypothetical protein
MSRVLAASPVHLLRLEAAMLRLAALPAGHAALRRLATDLAWVQAWEAAWQQQQQQPAAHDAQQQRADGGGGDDGRAGLWRAVERLLDNALRP